MFSHYLNKTDQQGTRVMTINFVYNLAVGIPLIVSAEVTLGDEPKAELLEVWLHNGDDFPELEIDDIYIGSGNKQQSLITILEDLAIEKAADTYENS